MIVPGSRLLVLVALVGLPAAALTALPSYELAGYCAIAIIVLIALGDLIGARRVFSGFSISGPELVRMWKTRESSIDLTVRGRGAIRLALSLPPEITPDEEIQRIEVAGAVRVSWTCTPAERGRFTVKRCAAEADSPLKLWAVRRHFDLNTEIRVYPDLSSALKLNPSFLRRGASGIHAQRQIGKGREFEKLRDYSSGDSFDEIDWKATARRGRPITRVFQIERTQEVYVVLDGSRLMARRISEDSADTLLERNITATLLLALEAEKQGDRFGLLTFSDRVHAFVRASNGKAHYGACREALSTLRAEIVNPDYDEVCSLLRLRLRRRALLVFLTSVDDPVLAESYVRNVALLRRQHVVLTGMLRPAGAAPLFEAATVESADAIYDRLAGHEQWRKLRELAKVLERQGIRFSLFEPETLAAELASSYVNLKRRQVL